LRTEQSTLQKSEIPNAGGAAEGLDEATVNLHNLIDLRCRTRSLGKTAAEFFVLGDRRIQMIQYLMSHTSAFDIFPDGLGTGPKCSDGTCAPDPEGLPRQILRLWS
jgi:hypothetical protein